MTAFPIPDSPDGNVLVYLDLWQKDDRAAVLTPDQIRVILADNARLVEKANATMRQFWGEVAGDANA